MWVYLCPPCAGYAPLTAEDYRGALSGQCQGCGSYTREIHRFRAYIESAAGCGCIYSHEQRMGDVRAGDIPARAILAHMDEHWPGGAGYQPGRRYLRIAAQVAALAFTTEDERKRQAAEALARGDYMACQIPEEPS